MEAMRAGRDAALAVAELPAALEMDLFLATLLANQFLAATLDPKPAFELLRTAADRADGARLHVAAAKISLALGALAMRAADYPLAAEAFGRAAAAAEKGAVPALAIEALYLGGEVCLAGVSALGSERLINTAAGVWAKALKLAAKLSADEARSTRAAECARRLADLCRRYNLVERADEALAAAERFGGSAALVAPPPAIIPHGEAS